MRNKRGAAKLLVAAAVTAAAIAASVGAGTALADPTFGTMNDGGGVYWRSAPNWSSAIAQSGYGVYPGTVIAVHCYQTGSTVPGSADTMWVQASWVSGAGRGSGWINEHFVNDGAAINRAAAGVPPCNGGSSGGGGSSGPTGAENGAVQWAKGQIGSGSFNGACLAFVFDAWSTGAGVNLRNWVNVAIGSNTYPVDIWGHFTHGSTGGGVAPFGALVFYASTTGDRTLSHVALSLGGGQLISTDDGVASRVHYESMSQHSYAIELGWWLPDR